MNGAITAVIAVHGAMAALWATVMIRAAIVHSIIQREIREADARCGRAIAAGAVKSHADVRQEFASARRANDHYLFLVLDLRKWTHRQFFPHGSAR